MSEANSKNISVWMDIPVADLDRACRFYAGVLGRGVERESYEGYSFAVIEHGDGNGACLVPGGETIAADKGPLVYLNVDGRIRHAVTMVRELGGAITQDVHAIGPHGVRALIVDSEGNRFALHATRDA
ncbi:MAG: VOC family protein [Nannocystaceae bacterium]